MVLNRVASNFVQPRTRTTRDAAKNENVDSSAKSTSRSLKSTRAQSVAIAHTRDRRSRLSGGLKGRLQRVKESKKRHGRTQTTHTQPTRTHVEAASSSTSLPHSSHGQQRNEAHADIEMASEDPRGQEAEPKSYAVHQLYPQLMRPSFKEVTGEQLAAIHSSLRTVPAPYVRENAELLGPSLHAALARTNIIDYHGQDEKDPRLPAKVIVERPECIALEPSHAFAVHSDPISPNTKRKVSIQLGHSLLLAAHCSNLPPIPPPSHDDGFVLHEDARGKFVRYKLDVVPLRVPCSALFPVLVTYLCTLDEERLLNVLLGVQPPPLPVPSEPAQLPTPAPSPPHLNQSAVEVKYLTQDVQSLSAQLAALHADDGGALLFKAQAVWNLHRNAISLGVSETGLWTTMETAWSVLVGRVVYRVQGGRAPGCCQLVGHSVQPHE